MRSFIETDLSDTDNIVPFRNTTPVNLINLLCVLLFPPFSLINRSGIFERYNVVVSRNVKTVFLTKPVIGLRKPVIYR